MQIDTDTAKVTITGAQKTTGDLTVDGGDVLATDGSNAVNLFATTTAKVVCSPASSILSSLNHPSQPRSLSLLALLFATFAAVALLFRPVPSSLLLNPYHRSLASNPPFPTALNPESLTRLTSRHLYPLHVLLLCPVTTVNRRRGG